MMYVWVVRVRMSQDPVLMFMSMRLASIPNEVVLMLVMFVMGMVMGVPHPLMGMQVRMPFGYVEPHT